MQCLLALAAVIVRNLLIAALWVWFFLLRFVVEPHFVLQMCGLFSSIVLLVPEQQSRQDSWSSDNCGVILKYHWPYVIMSQLRQKYWYEGFDTHCNICWFKGESINTRTQVKMRQLLYSSQADQTSSLHAQAFNGQWLTLHISCLQANTDTWFARFVVGNEEAWFKKVLKDVP